MGHVVAGGPHGAVVDTSILGCRYFQEGPEIFNCSALPFI